MAPAAIADAVRVTRGPKARCVLIERKWGELRGSLINVAVKAPGFGDRRKAMLQDIAVLTGGQLVSQELGIRLENVTPEQLGRVSRVVVVRMALENAVSAAGVLLLTEATMTEVPEPKAEHAAPAMDDL